MGVAGLWQVLRPAGKTQSLTHLSVTEGFEANAGGQRGFRIGIDASIWFFHSTTPYGREGENPELRMLFFRCARLMGMPLLPLFIFDGPKRPSVKRGKMVSKNAHWLTTGMKNIIHAFGFEWRTAPGEAEAELAYLNRIGIIDAVLSDDVDNFLFGATMVIRNPSNMLSGNRAHPVRNADGCDDGNHVITYRAADLISNEDVRLSQGGCILIGLLSGGDYHQPGVQGCGRLISTALARCRYGDQLLEAARSLNPDELEKWLTTWRDQVRDELHTNKSGLIGLKKPVLTKKIPDGFPSLEILLSYTNPITSKTEGKPMHKLTWEHEPDIRKIAGLCELYFEWGVKDIITKRFRTILWPSMVLHILRRGAMEKDKKKYKDLPTSPKKNKTTVKLNPTSKAKGKERHFSNSESEAEEDRLIVKIHSSRRHASTDGILEYRLEIAPVTLVQLAESGVQGIRPPIEADAVYGDDEDEDEGKRKRKGKKPPPDPESHIRVWMPACMVETVEPELVEAFKEIEVKKLEEKTMRSNKIVTKKKDITTVQDDSDRDALPVLNCPPRKKTTHLMKAVDSEKEWDSRPQAAYHLFSSTSNNESHTGPRSPIRVLSIQQSSQCNPKKHTKLSDSESPEPHTTKSPRKLDSIRRSHSPSHSIRPTYDSELDETTTKVPKTSKGTSSMQGDDGGDDLHDLPDFLLPVHQKKAIQQPGYDKRLTPRPFPMSDCVSTSEDLLVDPNSFRNPAAQRSPQTSPKKHTKSSEFVRPCRIFKSPRKSPRQPSPRSGLGESGCHRFEDVINISESSDSDISISTKPFVKASLLFARERAKERTKKGIRPDPAQSGPPVLKQTSKGKSHQVIVIDHDIIDLTSS